MKMRYHLGRGGEPMPCKAKEGGCPLKGDDGLQIEHFTLLKEAEAAATRRHLEDSPLLPTLTKDSSNALSILSLPTVLEVDEESVKSLDDYEVESREFFGELTEVEVKALDYYTNVTSHEVNAVLWKGVRLDSSMAGVVSDLDSALSKARHLETPRPLYRRIITPSTIDASPPEERWGKILEEYSVGKTFEALGYSSTTEEPSALGPMLSQAAYSSGAVDSSSLASLDQTYQNVVFRVLTDYSAPVSSADSDFLWERENLLPRGSRFRVVRSTRTELSTTVDERGRPLLYKEEIFYPILLVDCTLELGGES